MTQVQATCRIQLRNGLDFDGLIERLDYLHELGISHLYLSPIFTAIHDSTHGYDCVNPNTIDPVLGGESGFIRLCDATRSIGMGLVLDIVPNHLGIGADNPYWQALLRGGPNADSASMFDVDWQSLAGGTPGKLLLPVLGEPLPKVLENGQLSMTEGDDSAIQYFEHQFPLAPNSQLESIAETIECQHWELTWWRNGNRLLNWRRFFDITTLAGIRVEDPLVFERMHQKVLELLQIDVVQGLRIDHIDGLANPGQYLERLDQAWRERRNDAPWILVEKILAPHETLPDSWRTDGTTGYETLNRLTSVFVHPKGVSALKDIWSNNGQDSNSFEAELAGAKREILTINLAAELHRLSVEIHRCPQVGFSMAQISEALVRLIIATDCYRSYGPTESHAFEQAMASADWSTLPAGLPSAMNSALPANGILRQRFEQLSAPAMAKSLEDTVFYRWYPVLALNEVGGEPHRFYTPSQLHEAFADPDRTRPRALIPTATHDTKRGEDTRVRLIMLTHPALRWGEQLAQWQQLCKPLIKDTGLNEKVVLLILQTVYSIWVVKDIDTKHQEQTTNELLTRLSAYFIKAFREAKEQTSWLEPDDAFEASVQDFISRLLDIPAFTSAINSYVKANQSGARRVSIGMMTIKLCLPGIPDLYHGCESEDLSLVDPDNRRPVNIDKLRCQLKNRANSADSPNAKQLVIHRLLSLRQEKPDLFLTGSYHAITLPGDDCPVFAFERLDGNDRIIVVVNRWPTKANIGVSSVWMKPLSLLLDNHQWFDAISQTSLPTDSTAVVGKLLDRWSAGVYVKQSR